MSWMSPLTVPINILLGRARGDKQRAKDGHSCLHRVGGKQHFRHEKDAIAEINADDAHAFDEGFRQNLVGGPAAPQQDVDALHHLFLEAVIEVVMDLLGQLLIIEAVQVQIASIAHGRLPLKIFAILAAGGWKTPPRHDYRLPESDLPDKVLSSHLN
jgi:hypothetical protein